jgi:dCMP deaminase
VLDPSPRWDAYFIELCRHLATLSKDQSTKLGCVIVGPAREVRATGYNSFPRGIDDDVQSRQERPQKYLYFEHAERNALYHAARVGIPVSGCSLYCQWLPCADCARAIIQTGIVEVVVVDMSMPDRWNDSVKAGAEMLKEAGVLVRPVAVNT